MTALVLYIDGKATTLLKPQRSKATAKNPQGNLYFSPSPQATRFGIKVDSTVLPNGLSTKFSVGTTPENAVEIATEYGVKGTGDRKVFGTENVSYAGSPMRAYVSVKALDRPGHFNLVTRVTNVAEAKVSTASDIFA